MISSNGGVRGPHASGVLSPKIIVLTTAIQHTTAFLPLWFGNAKKSVYICRGFGLDWQNSPTLLLPFCGRFGTSRNEQRCKYKCFVYFIPNFLSKKLNELFIFMDKVSILQTLIEQYCGGNKAKFARMVGTTPQAINGWFTRKSFDLELVYSKCENLSGDWLLNGGIGPMMRQISADGTEHTATPHTEERSSPYVTPLLPAAVNDELESLRTQLRSSREAVGELYEENRRLRAQISILQAAASTAG